MRIFLLFNFLFSSNIGKHFTDFGIFTIKHFTDFGKTELKHFTDFGKTELKHFADFGKSLIFAHVNH